jgi:hypothetical protein
MKDKARHQNDDKSRKMKDKSSTSTKHAHDSIEDERNLTSTKHTQDGIEDLQCQQKAFLHSTQQRASLHCSGDSSEIRMEETAADVMADLPVVATPADRQCLKRIIKSQACSDHDKKVPRVAHYVWFGKG